MQGFLLLLLLAPGAVLGTTRYAPHDNRAFLLSEAENMVFKRGFNTVSGGRTPPVPQMRCIKGEACGSEDEPSSVFCERVGLDYATGDPNWKCTATLASGLRLGSTDVVCEGFRNRDDPWVLRGSCALEYTLEGRRANSNQQPRQQQYGRTQYQATQGTNWWNWIFGALILWWFARWFFGGNETVNAGGVPGGGGGGGGRWNRWTGGGWGGGGYYPGGGGGFYPGGADCNNNAGAGGAGFWQGVGLGGLGGYMMGQRNNNYQGYGYGGGWGGGGYQRAAPPPPPPPRQHSPPSETSSGYGTTRRRG